MCDELEVYHFRLHSKILIQRSIFQDNLGKPAPEMSTILDFNEARDDGMAVASAGLYANHLQFAADR